MVRQRNRANTAVVQCAGKQPFDSFGMANTIANKMRRSRMKGNAVQVYRCDFCNQWHIGRKMG